MPVRSIPVPREGAACGEQNSPRKQFRNGCRPKRRAFSWFSPKENHTSRLLSGNYITKVL
jgi:hypothetical protein